MLEGLIHNIQEIFAVPEFLINQCTFLPVWVRDAVITSVKFVPWLYFLYYLIELLERFFLKNIGYFINLCKKLGPIFGVAISVIPECGYQVIASTFYARHLISRGTLLAFFISCSDDALPLLLMDFSKAAVIVPLVVIKMIVGIAVAFVVDAIFVLNHRIENTNTVNLDINEPGCCHHQLMSTARPPYWWAHPLLHTFNVFMFTCIGLIIINCVINGMGGEENVALALMKNSPLQVVAGAILGLIPNSVTSIMFALAYVKGIISFPTLLAGMITTTGLGLYALSKYHKKNADNSLISGILLAAGVITGLFIYYNMQFVSIVKDYFIH